MNKFSMIGAMVVLLALTFYTIGFGLLNRRKEIGARILSFYFTGLVFDISATILMILGSSHGMLTAHGFIGYSSLLGMATDAFLLWRKNSDTNKMISRKLHLYSKIAYIWWVAAFITGGLLVALRNSH